MAGLGLLFAGLSGAGKAVASSAEQDQKVAAESRLMNERAKLEEEKALRIDEIRRQRDRQASVQMGSDITAETSNVQNQRDAEAINAKNGSQMSAEDAAVLRDNPEARKAYGLLGSTRQTDLEDRAGAAERLGYLDAARETRNQLNTEVTNQRNIKNDENQDKRLDAEVAWRKDQAALQARQEDRRTRVAEAELALRRTQAAKADSKEADQATREARMATTAALKGIETDIKQLAKDAADPMLAPEQKAVVMGQLADARDEAKRYRSALAGAGLDGSAGSKADKPFNPADFPVGGKAAAGGKGNANPFEGGAAGGRVPAKLTPGSAERLAAADSAPPARAPARAASPREQAMSGLDAALQQTGRELAAAQASGDQQEIQRLLAQFQQQQAARQRTQ